MLRPIRRKPLNAQVKRYGVATIMDDFFTSGLWVLVARVNAELGLRRSVVIGTLGVASIMVATP